jgi:hypothetical protein
MANTTTDPFSLLYTTLWNGILVPVAAAGASADGRSKVQTARFDEFLAPNALKDGPPEGVAMVSLLQGKMEWDPYLYEMTSLGMTLSYPLVIVSRGLPTWDLNKMKWAAARAMVGLPPYLGLPRLVRKVRVRGGGDDPGDRSSWAAGSARWVTMLTVDVVATIDKADVIAGEYPATLT